jgi:small subunit ribosomal protein S5
MNMEQRNTERGELVDKLVGIRRVAKTVKGGRRMAFSAIVVVGDEGGRVGWGKGKAREVPDAVRKATDTAKRAMVRVPMRHGRTVHHEIEGRFGAARVILKPAVPGTGIIAGGPMRAVFEAMGIKDVVAKSLGSNNPFNMIQATFNAFEKMETPRSIAAKRGLKTSDLVLYRQEAAKGDTDPLEEVKKEAEAAKAKKAADKKPAKKAKPAKKDQAQRGKQEKKSPVKAEEKKVQAEKKSDSVKKAAKASEAKPATEKKEAAKIEAEAASAQADTPAVEVDKAAAEPAQEEKK